MQRGYVKIWRNLEDSGLLQKPEVCQLFLYLMLKVTYRPRKILVGTHTITLQPGQFFTGRKKLALELKMTERKVRTSLETLKNMGIMDQQVDSKGSIISLVNWHGYQSESVQEDQHNDQQLASTRPASDPQMTTKQEDKNIKIKNTKYAGNTNTPCARDYRTLGSSCEEEQEQGSWHECEQGVWPQRQGATPKKTDFPSKDSSEWTSFFSCYKVYPVKQGQEDAWREWVRLKNNRVLEPAWVIHDAILNLSANDSRWLEGMVPRMAKWLSGKGWNDEPYVKPNTGKEQNGGSPLPNKTPEQRAKEHAEGEKILAAIKQRSRQENKKLLEKQGVA